LELDVGSALLVLMEQDYKISAQQSLEGFLWYCFFLLYSVYQNVCTAFNINPVVFSLSNDC
jgi:hypothetical protein